MAGASGLGSYFGQRETNQMNLQIAREMNKFNAAEAVRNRQFQERMSNTSHRREVADLKAAGLNPLLSATGGSSTPAGATATAGSAHMENAVQSGITSAMEAKNLELAMRKQDSEIGLLNAQTTKTAVEAEAARKDIPASDLKNQLYNAIQPIVKKGAETIKGTIKEAEKLKKNIKDEYDFRFGQPSFKGTNP